MKREVWLVLILLGAALLLRMAALFFIDSISNPQLWEYEDAANNFLAGKGMYYTFSGAKYYNNSVLFYSLICAIIYYFTSHSFLAVKLFQIILSVLGCFIVYRIGRRLFGYRTALIAMGMMALHPGLIVYSVKIHALSLDVLLFLSAIYFFLYVVEKESVFKNGFLTGLFTGLALLSRGTVGLFVPVAFLIMVCKMKDCLAKIVVSVAGISIGLCLVLSPVMIRNYVIFHKVAPFPNDSGYNFWTGNNALSTGTGKTADGTDILEAFPKDFRNKIALMDEFKANDFFYREGRGFIKNNPGKFFALFARKLYYFWAFTPTQGLEYPKPWFLAYRLFYLFIVVSAVAGFFIGLKKVPDERKFIIYVLILFMAVISIAQALYYVEGRHRWAIEPLILIFSAFGIKALLDKLKVFKGAGV